MLQSFFAEFGEDDDVLLLLRSKPPGGALAEFKAAFRCEELEAECEAPALPWGPTGRGRSEEEESMI